LARLLPHYPRHHFDDSIPLAVRAYWAALWSNQHWVTRLVAGTLPSASAESVGDYCDS
jgi:hypothetical protein